MSERNVKVENGNSPEGEIGLRFGKYASGPSGLPFPAPRPRPMLVYGLAQP